MLRAVGDVGRAARVGARAAGAALLRAAVVGLPALVAALAAVYVMLHIMFR